MYQTWPKTQKAGFLFLLHGSIGSLLDVRCYFYPSRVIEVAHVQQDTFKMAQNRIVSRGCTLCVLGGHGVTKKEDVLLDNSLKTTVGIM